MGTTGPEMRRFFFTVDEAVNLVVTALDNIDLVRGKVLSRKMKAAKMEEILKIWAKISGGRYEKIAGRPGERDDEYLIGDLELAYTREIVLNDIVHYLISFNEKVDNPVAFGLSSANTERLSEAEITHIIQNPPVEEI
jgi:FlaA1/EpsC-like NDP-sugar epimerase